MNPTITAGLKCHSAAHVLPRSPWSVEQQIRESLRKTTVAAPVLSMGTRTADAALRAEVAVRGCDSEDTLFLDVRVPDDLRSGDRLSILTAGA